MDRRIITASEWFHEGQRIPYNSQTLEITSSTQKSEPLKVFVRQENFNTNNKHCITLLPGFPDGSFGWAYVEEHLKDLCPQQRLYLDYVGQGDSDKPEDYNYGIMERADLVESMWARFNITETFVVTFDYSSLVLLELLKRQQEQTIRKTKINKVLIINGGLFTDGHTHPFMTTPLLKTKFGKMGTKLAQTSKVAFNLMMKDLWSKDYGITKAELSEVFDAITRRNGAVFMSNAAGFVDEHKSYGERLDFLTIYKNMHHEVSFHLVGSEKDQFEHRQITLAKERLKSFNPDIRIVPGGHMTTSEQPKMLSDIILEINALQNQ